MTMTRETLDSLAAICDAVFGREPTPYDYRDEPWDRALQQLPPTCMLWQRFREFDTARRAFEAIDETHHRWQNELSMINQRLRGVNPDTADVDVFVRDHARGNLIEIALKEQQAVSKERRQRRDQAEGAWQQIWGAYQALLVAAARQKDEAGMLMVVPGMYNPGRDARLALEHERRIFEAPQG